MILIKTSFQSQRVTTRLSASVQRVSYMQSSTASSGTIDSNTQANYTNYSQADQAIAPDDTQQAWWQKPAAIITGLIATVVGLAFAGWKLRKPNPIETASNNKKNAANPLGETKSGEKPEEKPTIDIPDFGFFGDTKPLLEKIIKDFKPSDFDGKEVKVFNQANTAEAICVVPFKDALEIISLEIKLADSSINNEDKHRLQELRQIHKLNAKGEWLKFASSFMLHSATFKVEKLFAEVKDKLISELPNKPIDQGDLFLEIERPLIVWFRISQYSGSYIHDNYKEILRDDSLSPAIRFNIEREIRGSDAWAQIERESQVQRQTRAKSQVRINVLGFHDCTELFEGINRSFSAADFPQRSIAVKDSTPNSDRLIAEVPFADALSIIELEIKLQNSWIGDDEQTQLSNLRKKYQLDKLDRSNNPQNWNSFILSSILQFATLKQQKLLQEVKHELVEKITKLNYKKALEAFETEISSIDINLQLWLTTTDWGGMFLLENLDKILADENFCNSMKAAFKREIENSNIWNSIRN